MVAAGLGVGIISALVVTRVLHGVLDELNAADPAGMGLATAAVSVIALLASFLPATARNPR